jgi:DNA-binding LacI/PurR family transcriptional regulator
MLSFGRCLPRKVELARDALVRYIHDHHLQAGDRLPSYSQLRNDFGLGSETIAGAVLSLEELDVLEVRNKVGIFVKNPNGGHLAGRTIAVVSRSLSGSAYSALLSGLIQKLVSEQNCNCLVFYRQGGQDDSADATIDEFTGLEQAVNEHRIDGIITMCSFDKKTLSRFTGNNVKCCFIGDDDRNQMPCSVVIGVKDFIKNAKSTLEKRGCRKIVQFCTNKKQSESRAELLPVMFAVGYDGGADVAKQLLSMAENERPDGIVSDDDTLVSGFLAELLVSQKNKISYMPLIATITHTEVGEKYPSSEVVLFNQNIEEYAGLAVGLLMQLMQNKKAGDEKIVYHFNAVDL